MPLLDDIIASINEDEEKDKKNETEEQNKEVKDDKAKHESLITYSDEFYETFKG